MSAEPCCRLPQNTTVKELIAVRAGAGATILNSVLCCAVFIITYIGWAAALFTVIFYDGAASIFNDAM